MFEVLRAYQTEVTNGIMHFGGHVAKLMGDRVLGYFGWPKAHEDDAERAVLTGLALVQAVGRLQAPERLHVRIGIDTGLVIVGDLIGVGEAQERGVVGDTPNVAARLQLLAEPDTVLIGFRTRQLLGELFEYRDLGLVQVKGFLEPIQVYQVLRSSAVESRFEALHGWSTFHPARRSRRGNRAAAPPVATSKKRQRSSDPDFRRNGNWQVALDRKAL